MYPQNDNSDIQDRLSFNAIEHAARAADDSIPSISHEPNADKSEATTSPTILTSVYVPSPSWTRRIAWKPQNPND